MWEIEMSPIRDWLRTLDDDTIAQIIHAAELLAQKGPNLRRPLVGKITGSSIKALKELRPGSTGHSEVRILFVFDPHRRAIMLVGGDKSGKWNKWYKTAIPQTERTYQQWMDENERD
ncbi:type II toxin-antitoxin system RelE/ParE family toxin [Bifidobacterium pseudolongum]|uniref:type II toxin-antitoxin system RelE/ParE family toxin n=1 Tax=Bifidobacterium pseudolongum TaxID=1694 RepID=UPI0035198894|nr:addiction module toxin RelE [Bifidobacterium pseudolongum]